MTSGLNKGVCLLDEEIFAEAVSARQGFGFAINKYPTATSEYLIRRANDKLHTEKEAI